MPQHCRQSIVIRAYRQDACKDENLSSGEDKGVFGRLVVDNVDLDGVSENDSAGDRTVRWWIETFTTPWRVSQHQVVDMVRATFHGS